MVDKKLFCLTRGPPRIDFTNAFDRHLVDATAIEKYRFTISQLAELSIKLRLDPFIVTATRDKVTRIEALAIVCRRLSELSKLFTVANEFGRSIASYYRIFLQTVRLLHSAHAGLLYLNKSLIKQRMLEYSAAVRAKGVRLTTCWGFIDGTKQYISRPIARRNPSHANENLQRSVYNGHPRRHCLNWQGITCPDGIMASMYGPVEGRRHDSTVLAKSEVLKEFQADQAFQNAVVYGDPAYSCSAFVVCPFSNPRPGSCEAKFNARMSSVRESVEWGFGRIKVLWPFIDFDKKQKALEAPIGKIFNIAVLLSNCHCCLQPLGNQISMYFDLAPPTLNDYLGINE
ncbi:hypothetical protein Ae201684_001571 [Aphanomyces euteiches]|uniref:DDE Tnp4 domain-containing protein n=1 Tax=Aphanomyces euteiches TaxID=100861 RepID=A0A6G0XU73_9STRA|nr:hypothetical protein Ae201684_001571 [Aphanomyces euteiches]